MAGDSGYSIHTHYITIDAFLRMIKSDIQKLIRKYGHINCGLKHKELCDELGSFIYQKKTPLLNIMNTEGKEKWNREWSSKRNEFLNRLFDEEGFTNMCYPKRYPNNPSLNQLMSKHIDFCKEKDERLSALQKKSEYSACIQYNRWIDKQRTEFTNEYLNNAREFRALTVNKYFSTKDHPGGHDPRGTYLKSKLDCKQYNLTPRSNPKIPVAEAPTNKLQPSMEPNIIHGPQGKDGGSVRDKDSGSAKIKPEENKSTKPKSPTPDSPISAPAKTQTDSTHTDQDTHVRPKAPAPAVSSNRGKPEATPIQSEPPTKGPTTAQDEAPPLAGSPPPSSKDAALKPIIQSVPEPTTTTSSSSTLATVKETTLSQTPASSLNSSSSEPSYPLPPSDVTKDQDTPPHSTTTPVTSTSTPSTETLPSHSAPVLSLAQPQPPDLNTPPAGTAAHGPGTPVSSSANTFTTTVTITTMSPAVVTNPTMSTAQAPISSIKQVYSVSDSQEPPPPSAAEESKATVLITDGYPAAKSAGDVLLKSKVPIQASEHLSRIPVMIADNTLQNIPHHTKQQFKPTEIQYPPKIDVISPSSNRSDASVNTSKDGSTVKNNINDNSNTEPKNLLSLINIIPVILIILTSFTALFLLYKYPPFGFLLGRRRKRKKRDLRRTFEIPEKPTYGSPNITVHEWEDHNLVRQTVEKDTYTKLLKINRYKQEMQKRKKENKKTLIEVHMEVLEEYKSDEWELHKGDFLEICLCGFINEKNDLYSNLTNSELTINNIKNEKTIEDIQKHEILWNNWIENHRNILEQWKKEEWFQILKNKWRNIEQMYKGKNNKLQENILNEQDTYSIVSQKEIWKQWISKQAALIDLFNKEDWFKSLVYVQDEEKDNYLVNEYNNITVTNENKLKNEKVNHEHGRSKNIIKKLMVQIHMMVLEECIKEDIIKHKELCIDNFIEDIHNQNNYDEIRNIPQCDTDDFSVPEYEEIHTSKNK
ncbi:STP1 protein [Plasmodium ovale]|uniref:STP1 protein n=1 Tax=Plasmodium ovale TaxID=36330 RepID=A0A1C3KFK5_PLAOA|nr:STP1 protein [Plasmodium ovale]